MKYLWSSHTSSSVWQLELVCGVSFMNCIVIVRGEMVTLIKKRKKIARKVKDKKIVVDFLSNFYLHKKSIFIIPMTNDLTSLSNFFFFFSFFCVSVHLLVGKVEQNSTNNSRGAMHIFFTGMHRNLKTLSFTALLKRQVPLKLLKNLKFFCCFI